MALNFSEKDTITGKDYTAHLTSKPITGQQTSSKSVKGQLIVEGVSESKTLNDGVFTDGTSLTVEGGRVINLGNYETARVGVSITIPCTKDTLGEAYDFATEWISNKIEEAVNLAKS